MKTLAHITLISALLLLHLMRPACGAATVTYTDRTTFLGSVVNPTTFDFEPASGFPAAPASLTSFAAGAVLLTTDGGDAAAALQAYSAGSFGQAIGGQSGGHVQNFFALRMTFTPPRFAVGFDDLDLTASPREFAIINVVFANGAPTQRFSVTDPDGDLATAAFFGAVSSDPIASIQVYSGDSPFDPPGMRANLIDNVILAEVPEPSTYALLAVGGPALLLLRKRKTTNAA